jgi:hypothetical protein
MATECGSLNDTLPARSSRSDFGPQQRPSVAWDARSVTKTLPLAIVALGVLTPSAHAFDWTVRSTLTETVEASDNRKLLTNPKGPSYTSLTSLLFDATARTLTSRFNLTGGLSYSAYAGPGETDTRDVLNNNVAARFEQSGKTSSYFITATRTESETSQIQLEETGVSTLTGSTIATSFGGGFRHDLTRRDTIAWQTTYSTSEFTLSPIAPFKSLTSSLNYTHRANQLTTMTSSLQHQQLMFDGAQPDVTIWQAMVGMQTQLSRQLGVQGSVGTTIREGGSMPISTSTSGSGLIFNFALNYRPIRFLEAAVTVARSTSPTSFGQIQSSDTVGGSLRYTISEASSALFAASMSTVSGASSVPTASGTFDSFNAYATYYRRLSRGLQSTVSYRYNERESGATSARSNTVMFSLTWDATVLP